MARWRLVVAASVFYLQVWPVLTLRVGRGDVAPMLQVINMLKSMRKEIEAEGKQEEQLFQNFKSYCARNIEDLNKAIKDSEEKLPMIGSKIEEDKAETNQLSNEVRKAKDDRGDAQKALDEATSMRQKQAQAFDKESNDLKDYIAALGKAIAALERGMAESFLQTPDASILQQLSQSESLESADREVLAAFLADGVSESEGDGSEDQQADGSAYAPRSHEITGMLKQMLDDMQADLQSGTEEENKAIKSFQALKTAKDDEIKTLTEAIKAKTGRMGELGIELQALKKDYEDTETTLAEDKSSLAALEDACKRKTQEWERRKETRAEEVKAIVETIQLLSNGEASEMFRKTFPLPKSFLQMSAINGQARRQQAIAELARTPTARQDHRMNLIAIAMQGSKADFKKVIAMIDNLLKVLSKEQDTEDLKKKTCTANIEKAELQQQDLKAALSDLSKDMEDKEASLKTLQDELKALQEEVAKLDKEVAESTEQRKEDRAEFEEERTVRINAIGLLEKAKQRLQKFYEPDVALAQDQAKRRTRAIGSQPESPPPTWKGDYSKHGGGNRVLQLIASITEDFKHEIKELETDEALAQTEYETLLQKFSDQKKQSAKAITDKVYAKAALGEELLRMKKQQRNKKNKARAVAETLNSLHRECDELLKNYVVWKEGRSANVHSLQGARAVLSGADVS